VHAAIVLTKGYIGVNLLVDLDSNANLGDMLQEARESGQLKGRQIIEAKRLLEKRH
jgi:hypothetical protein